MTGESALNGPFANPAGRSTTEPGWIQGSPFGAPIRLAPAGTVTTPRVLVTRIIPDAGLGPVREACEVDLWEDELPPGRDELLRRVRGVDGLLSLLTDRVDDELLDAAGAQLKVVSNFAVGFDNIDVPALTRRGIPGGNTPGVLTETTADLAFALMMAAARRIPSPSTTSARTDGRPGDRCC